MSKRWATDIENIRTYRGANSNSDHFLVGARLKQKTALITRNRIENQKRWNIDKLDETQVQCHYQQEIQKELQRKPTSNDIEMIKAKRGARLKCIQGNTRANQEEYNRKRIAAARVCHRKKREALKRKVDAIVEHHTKNESKKFYKRIQEVTQRI